MYKRGVIMAVAVICEFNPFHNGHKYLLNRAFELSGEPVIAVMSGSFTQRGEVAVTDKFSRAKAALNNGADLVVELPLAYAVSNAERFAFGGVSLARAFDDVNYLAFGCESDDVEALQQAACSLDNPDVKAKIKALMNSGDYYPRAVEKAVREVYGDKTAEVLSTPNNVLAVEYIRALKGSRIKPLPIMRRGVAHDSSKTCGSFASASQIRALLRAGESAEKFMPSKTEKITYPHNLEQAVMYKLRSMTKADFAQLADVNEGLENRIFDAVHNYNSVEEIINQVKTKRYTHARIRRILTSALLGLTREIQQTPIEYARVLGFTQRGAALLKGCSLKVVTSASDGLKLGGNTEILLKKDILATDIAALAYKKPQKTGADFTTPIIKIRADK
jgi:cytidyltransferase-like protein